jgi:hypothetical protein
MQDDNSAWIGMHLSTASNICRIDIAWDGGSMLNTYLITSFSNNGIQFRNHGRYVADTDNEDSSVIPLFTKYHNDPESSTEDRTEYIKIVFPEQVDPIKEIRVFGDYE